MSEDQEEPQGENAQQAENVFDLNYWREIHTHKEEDKRGGGGGDGGDDGGNGGPPEDGDSGDSEPRPAWASDDAIASQTAARLDTRWYYVPHWGKWFCWNGKVWKRDEGLTVLNRVREVCRAVSAKILFRASVDAKIGAPAGKSDEPRMTPALARSVSSGRTIFNVERLARADERIQRNVEDFDANEWLLNTPGGIVDLRTGELYEHRREQLMTQMAGATPEGDCPVWRKFLREFTEGDQDYENYLQRLVGYSLTGSTEEECFAFLYGPANTGKSKFIQTVRLLHGSYGCGASMDTFVATQHHAHATEIARFVGKRLVTAAETDEGCRWDQQRMTSLTGRDEITANFMRQDQFSFYPKFLLMFHGNHRPRLTSDGGAMRRRMHLLPCRHRPSAVDRRLIDKLQAELGGIMKWGVLGSVLWKQHGLTPPQVVTEATDDYFVAEDLLLAWIEERCDVGSARDALTRDLYNDYKAWAKAANEYVLSERRFSEALANLQFKRKLHPRSRKSSFVGIALRVANDELSL
jgi:putative DNA primase/helicase